MKHFLSVVALALSTLVISAHAADNPCDAQASEKKLAGAAKASFVKKCVSDAKAAGTATAKESCDAQAADNKLAGAAKASFTKKCVADATK